jgi:ketosteroid isomerase-like protein
MNRPALLLACLWTGFAAAPVRAATDTTKDEQQIRADLDAECKAFENRDAVGAMAAYVKDDRLVQFDMFPPESVNKKGYTASVNAAPATDGTAPPLVDIGYDAALLKVKQQVDTTVGPLVAEVSDFHVTVDHNHAYSRYILNFSGTLKDGTPFHFIDRTTDVYEKIGGKWLIVLEHNSSPPA